MTTPTTNSEHQKLYYQQTTVYGGTGNDHAQAMYNDTSHNASVDRIRDKITPGWRDNVCQPLVIILFPIGFFSFPCSSYRLYGHYTGKCDISNVQGPENCSTHAKEAYINVSYTDSPSFGTGYSRLTLDKMAVCGCLLWSIGGGAALTSNLIGGGAAAATTMAPNFYDPRALSPVPKITKMG